MKIGPLEAAVILAVVLLIFGPSKLPGLAKAIGKSIVEFKESLHAKPAEDHPPSSPPDKQNQ